MSLPDHDSGRWETPFGRFIRHYGVLRLAFELKIDQQAIYQWAKGFTTPHPDNICSLVSLARQIEFPLDVTEIYAQRALGNKIRQGRKIKRNGGRLC